MTQTAFQYLHWCMWQLYALLKLTVRIDARTSRIVHHAAKNNEMHTSSLLHVYMRAWRWDWKRWCRKTLVNDSKLNKSRKNIFRVRFISLAVFFYCCCAMVLAKIKNESTSANENINHLMESSICTNAFPRLNENCIRTVHYQYCFCTLYVLCLTFLLFPFGCWYFLCLPGTLFAFFQITVSSAFRVEPSNYGQFKFIYIRMYYS